MKPEQIKNYSNGRQRNSTGKGNRNSVMKKMRLPEKFPLLKNY